MISSKFWNLETLTLHKRPSLWQEYLTTYEIHSLFQVAAGPSADIDKKRFRHKRFPNFCEKSIMQSKKSFPISTSYYISFPVMIDAIMRPTKHAKFACSWWDTRMFGRWKSLASQSHAHFWSALKKRYWWDISCLVIKTNTPSPSWIERWTNITLTRNIFLSEHNDGCLYIQALFAGLIFGGWNC